MIETTNDFIVFQTSKNAKKILYNYRKEKIYVCMYTYVGFILYGISDINILTPITVRWLPVCCHVEKSSFYC